MAVLPQEDRIRATPSTRSLESIKHTLFVASSEVVETLQGIFHSYHITPGDVVVAEFGEDVQAKTRTRLKALKASRGIRYVCLVGGWESIPPYQFENPSYGFQNDSDEYCFCDAPYGSCEQFDGHDIESVFPTVTVGRIPSDDPNVLTLLLLQQPKGRVPQDALLFTVSAGVWIEATDKIVNDFVGLGREVQLLEKPNFTKGSRATQILQSPNWRESHLSDLAAISGLEDTSILLFNVHGSDADTSWVGQDRINREFPVILKPDSIKDFNGAILISEACYGGKIDFGATSIVESFFANRGRAFVGCSMVAWGSSNDPVDADLIALGFLKSINRGREFGHALLEARRTVLEGLDPDEFSETAEKTILTFNLYGVPWDSLRANTTVAATLPSRPRESILERTRATMGSASGGATFSLLEQIRERYMRALGNRSRRFLIERNEARAQFKEFPDSTKVEEILLGLGLGFDDCKMESLQGERKKSYLISGELRNSTGPAQGVLVSMDSNGKFVRVRMTKGSTKSKGIFNLPESRLADVDLDVPSRLNLNRTADDSK